MGGNRWDGEGGPVVHRCPKASTDMVRGAHLESVMMMDTKNQPTGDIRRRRRKKTAREVAGGCARQLCRPTRDSDCLIAQRLPPTGYRPGCRAALQEASSVEPHPELHVIVCPSHLQPWPTRPVGWAPSCASYARPPLQRVKGPLRRILPR